MDVPTGISKENLQLPDTVEGCYAFVRTCNTQLEMINALTYWRYGSVAVHMETNLGVEHAIDALARETGSSDRMLRYCKATYDAFDYEPLRTLCRKGMQWSTVRELAADSVSNLREKLVELFMEDRITDLEVRNAVMKLKAGLPENALLNEGGTGLNEDAGGGGGDDDDPSDAGRTKQFESLRGKLMTHTKEFVKRAAEFNEKIRGELSDVVIGKDAGDKPEIVAELGETEAELQKVLAEAVDLIRSTHALSRLSDYPFETLEHTLEDIRTRFEVSAGEDKRREKGRDEP